MTEKTVDLKNLLFLIKENKDFDANLILDGGCTIETEDPKALIKALNYIINYLKELSANPLEISLDLRENDYLMNFLAYTDKNDFPEISSQLTDALKSYKANYEQVHEAGKYIQIKVTFKK